MKKIIFSAAAFGLVAVSSMALVPTTAEAIPAFARQTGAACLSCHFQEVPDLNAFGRSFKMGSFTSVGDQALIEDENLSIPAVLNASFVVRAQAANVNDPTQVPGATKSANYSIGADQNMLIAGRVGTNTGVFLEFAGGAAGGTVGGSGAAGGLNNMQVLNSFDVGDFKVGVGYVNTGFGADAQLTVNSVYGQHSGNLGDVAAEVSAVNHSGWTGGNSANFSTIGGWVGNDMGFIQVGLTAPADATGGNANVGTKLAKMIKVAATMDVAGFDTIVGFGTVAGTIGKGVAPMSMDMQWAFAQMQGDLGDMSLGVYADWAHAKGKGNGNILGTDDLAAQATILTAGTGLPVGSKYDGFSLRATLEPVSQIGLNIGFGNRKTSSLIAANTVKHAVFSMGAAYSVYQNMILAINYTNDKQTTGNVASNIKTTTLDYVIYM